MGLDDDQCVGGGAHEWRCEQLEVTIDVTAGDGSGVWSEYRCARCDAVALVPPD